MTVEYFDSPLSSDRLPHIARPRCGYPFADARRDSGRLLSYLHEAVYLVNAPKLRSSSQAAPSCAEIQDDYLPFVPTRGKVSRESTATKKLLPSGAFCAGRRKGSTPGSYNYHSHAQMRRATDRRGNANSS